MSTPAVEWPEAEQRIAELARTKRGRHRNKALASYRRTRALELRAQGMGYAEIAQQVGYTSKATAYRVISAALEAREAEDVDVLRHLVFDRLERLLEGLWPAAMEGHLPSAHAILKILDQEVRLLGLSPDKRKKTPQDDWPSCHGPATVVINPKDCRWSGCDRHGKFDGQDRSPLSEAAASHPAG